jgi:phage regulator Rha-like protein
MDKNMTNQSNALNQFVQMDGLHYITSNLISEMSEKRHDNILMDIEKLIGFYNET